MNYTGTNSWLILQIMKRAYKNLVFLSISGLLCLFLAIPANAQHRGGGGGGHSGGGGGGHYSGGGGHSYSGGGRSYSSAGRSYSSAGHSYAARPSAAGRSYAGRPNVGYGRAGVNAYRGGAYRGGYANRGGAYRGGYANRGGYRGGFAYRGYGYGGRFGYGGFYYHSGFYGSLYFPRLGFSLGFLPYGYYPFYFGDYQYYYSNGFYYQYNNDQYTVVEPPVGAQINTLPSIAQSIVINGQQYYELDGVYYVAITKDDGSLAYQIAGKDGELNTDGGGDQGNAPAPANGGNYDQGQDNAPAPADQSSAPADNGAGIQVHIGDIVPHLPANSRGVTVNGEHLFVSPEDIYFKATVDNNNERAYKVVGVPTDPPNN